MVDGLRSQDNGLPLKHGVIGTATRRYGGLERAMGAQKYIADLEFPDSYRHDFQGHEVTFVQL